MNEEAKIYQMRRYWLGFFAEQERCAFEASWFDNDEDSELVAAIRDDLIQDYLAGELDDDELRGFQLNLLGQLNLVEDMAFAGAINRVLAGAVDEAEAEASIPATEIGWFGQLTAGFRQFISGGVPAAAFGAIILVLFIGGILVWRSFTISKTPDMAMTQPNDINQVNPVAPVANTEISNQVEPPPLVQTPSPSSPPGKKKSFPTEKVYPKTIDITKRQGSYVALILGSATRGAGEIPEKAIPPEKENLRLIFPKPYLPNSYIKYSAKIVASDNGRVVGQSSLPDLSKKKKGQDVQATFPKKGLVPGKYKLVVVGKRSNANPEVLSEREFRIVKP